MRASREVALQHLLRMHRGVTLPELLLAVVLAGLLTLLVVPRLAAFRDGAAVREEGVRLLVALDQARGAAVRLGSNTRLALSDSAYTLSAAPIDTTVRLWRTPGPGSAAVRLTGAGAALLFGSSGVAVGASNRTLQLSKGSVTRRLVISRLGRILW